MNELRLQYHHDTGIRIHDVLFTDKTEEYIEWLEGHLEELSLVNDINQLLSNRIIKPIFWYGQDKNK